MSAPATKAFSPAPVMTTARTASSEPRCENARSSSAMVSWFMAFSFCGRLTVRSATSSRVSSFRFWRSMLPSRRARVVVETPSRLAAQMPREDHPTQERRRGETLLAELVEHDVRDVVRGIETHEVQKLERPHGVSAAELHSGIVVLLGTDSLLERADGVEHIGNQEAVHDEPRAIGSDHRCLSQPPREPLDRFRGLGIRGERGNDLDHFHQRDRIEEVEAHEPLWVPRGRGHLGDAQRRGIAAADGLALQDRIELPEQLLFHRQVFEHRLDDHVDVRELLEACRGLDARQDLLLLVRSELSPLPSLREKRVDSGDTVLEPFLVDLDHHCRQARARGHLSDSRPHEAAAHYSHSLDFHRVSPSVPFSAETAARNAPPSDAPTKSARTSARLPWRPP